MKRICVYDYIHIKENKNKPIKDLFKNEKDYICLVVNLMALPRQRQFDFKRYISRKYFIWNYQLKCGTQFEKETSVLIDLLFAEGTYMYACLDGLFIECKNKYIKILNYDECVEYLYKYEKVTEFLDKKLSIKEPYLYIINDINNIIIFEKDKKLWWEYLFKNFYEGNINNYFHNDR